MDCSNCGAFKSILKSCKEILLIDGSVDEITEERCGICGNLHYSRTRKARR